MKTLKESLLGDFEKIVSKNETDILKDMYPVPKVRDFTKYYGMNLISWKCENLIKSYIKYLDTTLYGELNDIVGFRISIFDKYELDAFLMDSNGNTTSLYGIGTNGVSIPNAKKAVIEFFDYVINNPECLITLFEHANKSKKEFNTIGLCNELTFKQILKY